MSALTITISCVYVIICLFLVTVIMLQKKRNAGLSTVSGMSQTYWMRNKGNSLEGKLEKFTKLGGFLFFTFTIILLAIR